MEQDHDDNDWRQQSERRRRTTASVIPAAGTLIAAIAPFLQLLLKQAAQEEPKPKKPRRERRVFDSHGAYDNLLTNLLVDDSAFYSRDYEDFFWLSQSRVERMMMQDFGNSREPF
jgi:hypothetical protein